MGWVRIGELGLLGFRPVFYGCSEFDRLRKAEDEEDEEEDSDWSILRVFGPANLMLDLRSIVKEFQLEGGVLGIARHGNGLINDTYRASLESGGRKGDFIIQRINGKVFREPVKVMENVERVCQHGIRRLKKWGEQEPYRRMLSLIPARDGKNWIEDEEGSVWRTYRYIYRARSFDVPESSDQAYQAARAFARFQNLLMDLPGPRLHETIAKFHDTPDRLRKLRKAVEKDPLGRVENAETELAFVEARTEDADRLVSLLGSEELPERVTHNDTKLNNVMIDESTGEGICVVDLDTVMPGSILYDFGDLVRSMGSDTVEGERDLSKVNLRMSTFQALTRGYYDGAADSLTRLEIELLPFSGKLISFEVGTRFLTDYLLGDVYFKTSYPKENLMRCRNQFKLVESIEANLGEMTRCVERIWGSEGKIGE